jgi:hypothetical protein
MLAHGTLTVAGAGTASGVAALTAHGVLVAATEVVPVPATATMVRSLISGVIVTVEVVNPDTRTNGVGSHTLEAELFGDAAGQDSPVIGVVVSSRRVGGTGG